MKKDYLWDGSGDPDPEVRKLESLLSRLRFDRPAPEFEIRPSPARQSRPWLRFNLRAAWACACVTTLLAAGWWVLRDRPSYEVVRLEGSPLVGSEPLGPTGRLQTGEWLITDGASKARIHIGDLGDVEIEANSRVRLLQAETAEQRLLLQRGILHARIWAPPRSFFVDTPFAQAVDLGCAYTLEVGDDGTGLLRVTSGWVAFEHEGRESFVPAGAVCLTHPGLGPGTPYQSDASIRLQTSLDDVDRSAANRSIALSVVLAEARTEDALTLWHLLSRTSGAERAAVYDRLAQLAPPPAGVTRTGVLELDRRMLDLWWDHFGLGDATFWRQWERPFPGRR